MHIPTRGGGIPPSYPSPNIGGPQARPGRLTTVRGGSPAPGQPCVVLITIGEDRRVGPAAWRAKSHAEIRNYHCLVINIGTDLNEAAGVLQSNVPADAKVLLITDASADEVAIVRAALPTPDENILDELKGELLYSMEPAVYRALDDLPDASTELSIHSLELDFAIQSQSEIQEARNDSRLSAAMRALRYLDDGQGPPGPGHRGQENYQNPFRSPTDRVWRPPHEYPQSGPQRPVRAAATNSSADLCRELGLDPELLLPTNWQTPAATDGLLLLTTLVRRALKETQNQNLKSMLRHLVEQMAVNPSLAERVFAVLQDGTDTCGDRVSLTLHQAELQVLIQPAWDGILTPHEMFLLARKVFRRTCIDELATKKVSELNAARRAPGPGQDEIETHLAYYCGLHESLELGGQKPDAKYISSNISGVTPNDIDLARRKILMREGEELWDFFATWTPWQDYLRAKLPDEVAEIEEVLSEPGRPERLEREVTIAIAEADVPLEFHPDAITRGVNQRGKEEERELWLGLTRKAWSHQDD